MHKVLAWWGEMRPGKNGVGRERDWKDCHFASSRGLMLSTDEGLTGKVASCPARDSVHAEGMLVAAGVKLSLANL